MKVTERGKVTRRGRERDTQESEGERCREVGRERATERGSEQGERHTEGGREIHIEEVERDKQWRDTKRGMNI